MSGVSGIGNYRACYTIGDGQLLVLVVTISTRDDVYARFMADEHDVRNAGPPLCVATDDLAATSGG